MSGCMGRPGTLTAAIDSRRQAAASDPEEGSLNIFRLSDETSVVAWFVIGILGTPYYLSEPMLPEGVRLRVRAEYCDHVSILSQNVLSNKQNRLEKQFDVFSQSNTVLKSRDLGSIICEIKFSELSYLDAFWNDYMNGSLLEALKGVFITDSLKQAVGQEAIQLLVSIDEDDYEEGRKVLLENIHL